MKDGVAVDEECLLKKNYSVGEEITAVITMVTS